MSKASFTSYKKQRITKYEPKHKWICLNFIMETTLKLIPNPLEFNINDSIKICDFELSFIQCLISKTHKKLGIIITKETVIELWGIAQNVLQYQSYKSQLEGIEYYLSNFDYDDESIEQDSSYIFTSNKVGKYKSILRELGYKTKYIPSCVKFYRF